ncbi:LCP family protein [Candidatus Gottesmanbacteria bacterium]|nr:LCP family protein [Candidatus Gottesmanbacteria bacterium]
MVKRLIIFSFCLSFIFLSIFIFSKINTTEGDQDILQTSNINIPEDSKPITYYNEIAKINEDDSISVLLLGLDGRAGDNRPRCDGIHMLSFIEKENKIIITSVPRGTYIYLPEVASQSAYISNACHYKGIDYAVLEIEKITGIHPDYIVKVGFSQAAGIFRLLNITSSETLQFLRNRRTLLGDFQRSHNQALFIKDMITKYFDMFMNYPKAVKYIAFTLLDTNIEYNQALDLLEKIHKSGLYKNPDNIVLTVKPVPNYILSDTHYDFNQVNASGDQEYLIYQNYINQLIANVIYNANYYYASNSMAISQQIIATPFSQKLWEQVDDEQQRNEYHFQLLRLFVLSSSNPKGHIGIVKDFIEQMEVYRDLQILEKSLQLLDQINN